MSQSRRPRPAPPSAWSWGSLLLTTRASWVVLLLGGAGLLIPSPTSDMLAYLGQGSTWTAIWHATAFYGALLALGLNAWYWARAALAAQFGIADGKRAGLPAPRLPGLERQSNLDPWIYEWLPRFLFLGSLFIGSALLLKSVTWHDITAPQVMRNNTRAAIGLVIIIALGVEPVAQSPSGTSSCVSVLTDLVNHDSIVALPRHGPSDGALFSRTGTTSGLPASG